MSLHPDFINELRKHFTGDIRLDTASRILYSTDASMYQIEPLGVAIPKTQDDLHSAVELAAKYKVPILPRGAGSSLGGQAIGHALILDCSRWLDSILDIDPDSRTADRRTGRRSRGPEHCRRPIRPDLRSRPCLRRARHDGRCDRQQRHGRAFHPLRHERGPRPLRRRHSGRRDARDMGCKREVEVGSRCA